MAYRGSSILDISSGELLDGATILVRGERIEAVLTPDDAIPAEALVQDTSGFYAVPGLIDVHQHYAVGPPVEFALMMANRAIYGGVTSARDMTGDTRIIAYLARQTLLGENGPPIYCSTDLAAHVAAQAHRAGVRFATGTDAWAPVDEEWPALLHELELLRDRAGMAPIDVLRAATVNAAEAIGRESEEGRLEAGKLANITFFSTDPLALDADFRTVVLTVKRGQQYWRENFVHVAPDTR